MLSIHHAQMFSPHTNDTRGKHRFERWAIPVADFSGRSHIQGRIADDWHCPHPDSLGAISIKMSVDSSGCVEEDMAIINVVLCTDIREILSSQQITLYPNPFSTSTTIELPNTGSHTLSIYDLVGNLVRTESVSGETIKIEKGTLTKGIYFIELRSEKETLKGKIVIE